MQEVEEALLCELPSEVLVHIFSFLPPKASATVLPLVCSRFYDLYQENTLWRKYCEKTWDRLHPVKERPQAWKNYFRARSETMQLLITLRTDCQFIARVSRYDGVEALYDIVSAQLGTEVGPRQSLVIDQLGKALRHNTRIGDYPIHNGSSLTLRGSLF
ncbi:F-box/WD repeat-containing protein 9 [Balamuthia mandrillaris]